MSKTVEGSYINLTDSLEEIKKKIARTPTDSGKTGGAIPEIGGVRSLYVLYKLLDRDKFEEDFEKPYKEGKIRYETIKNNLSEIIYKDLEPFQKRRAEIATDTKYIDEVIADGAARARKIARATVDEVKQKMGLL